jgi:hypothetical protein
MDTVQNPELTKVVTPDSPMKEWLLNYVGEKASPENDEVTTEMIVETMASEFPEFLMVIAEENWIRGYHQAMTDVEMGEKLIHNLSETKDENNGSE